MTPSAVPAACGEMSRTLISLVSLANSLVCSRYITPGTHWPDGANLTERCTALGLKLEDLDEIAARLPAEVDERTRVLGLGLDYEPGFLLRAISRANQTLARVNTTLRERERWGRVQGRARRLLGRTENRPCPSSSSTRGTEERIRGPSESEG